MSRYKASGHCVGESNWHSRFTPGYRRPIVHYLVQAAQELQLHVGAIECGPDHIHLFPRETRKYSVVVVARKLKGYTSRMMRKNHKSLFSHYLYGNKFWSAGYFYQTVGTITAESVKEYIKKGQQKHWTTTRQEQKTLINYVSQRHGL